MFGLENGKYQGTKVKTFVKRPGDSHIAGIDKEPEIQHDMTDEGIPFVVAEAALTPVFMRKTEKQVRSTHALMKSSLRLIAIRRYAIVVNKSSGQR